VAVEEEKEEKEAVDMETVFRLEREKREEQARADVARVLQAQARGKRTRRRVKAMQKVGAAMGRLKHMRTCREVVRRLVADRNAAAVRVQAGCRRRLGYLRVCERRKDRYWLCMDMMEREFGEGNLYSGEWGEWGEGEDEEGGEGAGEEEGGVGGEEAGEAAKAMRRNWLRVLPDNARPPPGCQLFADGCNEQWDGMLKLEF
jgi:hypothetical protein